MNNDIKRKTLYLGAFLHDIGKAIQRGLNNETKEQYYGKHPNQGYKFLLNKKELFKNIFSEEDFACLLTYVQAHHESYFSKEEERADKIKDLKLKCLATIVSRADNFSSQERGENESTKFDWRIQRIKPVYSIFEKIELKSSAREDISFYNFRRLNFENIFNKNINSEKELEGLIEEFSENLNNLLKIKNINNIEYGLNYLIYNYFWCIPANTKEKYPDISLYDHLKTTSAIATCIYDYHKEKNELEDYNSITNDSLPRFRLLVADFSGIQKYIFDISKQEKAGKRIRSRSFFVQMLLEDVKMMVLKEFNLPIFNTIFQSGGKFFILLPNLKDVEERINKIQNFINKESIQRFNGEISLNLALSDEFCGKKYKKDNGLSFENFEKVLENALEKLSFKKKKPFIDYLLDTNNSFSINNDFDGKKLCTFCRKFPVDNDKCNLCNQDIEIGEELVKSTSLFLCFSENGKFQLFKHRFDIKEKMNKINESDFVVVINPDPKNLDLNILKYDFIINYLGNYIPRLDFEEIAKKSCKGGDAGVKMLGILKADVDNLGKIFALGLKREILENSNTISRQTTLSRMFDFFFAGYINDVVKEKYSDCYILYSGGDDLVIAGPWDIIIDLAKEINNKFKEYTDHNPDITLSVGIYFCKHNYPFYKAVQNAEMCLEKAKENGKDSICLFNEFILKWKDFNKIYPDEMDRLNSWIKDEKISTQFARNLFKYGEMIRRSKNNNNNLMMWQPLFAYNITKIKDKEIEDWANKVSGMKKEEDSLFEILRSNLSLLAEYALYKNRK